VAEKGTAAALIEVAEKEAGDWERMPINSYSDWLSYKGS